MVKVLFIAAWQRSGTTVAGNVLGSAPSAVHIGELHYLWMKNHPAGFECGCGQLFYDCPLWAPVIDQLGLTAEKRHQIHQLHRESWRNSHVPARYREARRGHVDLAYPRALGELYAAVQQQSGAAVVIDSTKNPSDALAAALAPDVDVHLLHMVRDPRAVAYSGMRPKEYMGHYSARRSTFHWDVRNLLLQSRVRPMVAADRYRRVRYEDLMAAPRQAFGELLEWVGLDPTELPFTDESSIRMARSHTVMGNPIRHLTGDTPLRPDTRWVTDLAGRDRWTTTAVAAPLLAHYGYPYRSRAAVRQHEPALTPPAAR